MNDIQKKKACDILDSSGPDLRKALNEYFNDLNLSEPEPEDYQLLDSIISTIHEGMWTSNEPDFDFNKLKSEVYEALIDEKRAKTEEPEIYVGENDAVKRDRAVIDFTFNWLKCILR
jgi:hypothetical protein